jgi:alkylation response protein AidB-like acyl-CoA dehydrogenase
VKDILTLLEATSYESLPLTLMFGINIGLFLGPVAKYGNNAVKQPIFSRFTEQKVMGGMMITEPGHGSDALNMKTTYREAENGYNLNGTKHWQGLTGQAEYWLIAAKKEMENGAAGRDIDFFVCDTKLPGQQIVVEEYFDSLGLYMIPYGRNKVAIDVPVTHKLQPETTGIKMMLDILHRSRMQFPGMGIGFIKRMMDEAITHCKNRMAGAGNLLSMDQIAFKLSKIQSAYTMCSAMCLRSSAISGPEHNLATEGLEANSIKAVVTDMMQEAAQILVQVSGANGYRIGHIGGRGIVDSRPFQIFEGSNGMLYTQVADVITKLMKKQKEAHLFDFLKSFKLTAASCEHFKTELSFMLNSTLPQRKLHDLGKILSRVVSVGYVIDMAEKGFSADLIDNCITMVRQEVASLTASFQFENKVKPIEDYFSNSSWLKFA